MSKDKLYFHDQNDTSEVDQIDKLCGLPLTTCIGAGPGLLPDISVAKSHTTLLDPIPSFVDLRVVDFDTGTSGLDGNVTHIGIQPKGIFQPAGGNFTVQFKVGVK